MGKGAFPETHELHFGWPGMHGPKWSNLAMNTCDVLVAIGARFDDRVTGKLSAFAPGRDGRPSRHRRGRDLEAARRRHPRRRPARRRRSASWRATPSRRSAPRALRRRRRGSRRSASGARSSRSATTGRATGSSRRRSWRRCRRSPPTTDVIVTTGVGQHQMWAMQYVLTERPRNFITSGGLGTMGYGIPAAIGAKAARPEATVVCVDGDGCFQMTAQELATAVLEDLPIVVVLVNNGYLGMVTQWQDMFFDGRRSHVHLTYAGAGLREAGRGVRRRRAWSSTDEAELEPALEEALALGRTVVVDCRVDPAEQCFPMIPAGAAALDMIEYAERRGQWRRRRS